TRAPSSPRIPSSGKSSRSASAIARSHSRSAAVTGESSALSSALTPRAAWRSAISPARRAARRAVSSSLSQGMRDILPAASAAAYHGIVAMRRFSIAAWLVGAIAFLAPACDESSTAPTLSATCAANPSSGIVPLTVSFNLSVAGGQSPLQFDVDYGDGSHGTNPDAVHTYLNPGVYTAAFTVTSHGQLARCSTTIGAATATVVTVPLQDLPPTAVFRPPPAAGPGGQITGPAPLVVRFNMCPSGDPDGDRLLFTMDFNGDGRNEVEGTSGAACRRDSDPYPAGTWFPRICVTDIGPDGKPLHSFQCATYRVTAS